jgi:hypothetical protein
MTPFPFGKLLPPERQSFGELSRSFMCVSEEVLEKIAEHKARRLNWEDYCGRMWCTSRPRRGVAMIKLLLCGCGWWRVRLFNSKEEPHDLCFVLSDLAALFPSGQLAMKAGEIFSAGKHFDTAPFVWVGKDNSYHFAGGGSATH